MISGSNKDYAENKAEENPRGTGLAFSDRIVSKKAFQGGAWCLSH